MSDLVCISFKGRHTADQVLTELRSMQKEHLVDLEDSCIVTRGEDGKLQLKQAVNLRESGGPGTELEASGGMNLANGRDVAETGVDFISIGALTHSAPQLDVSLLLDPVNRAA